MGAFEEGRLLDPVAVAEELEDIRSDLDSKVSCIHGTLEEIESDTGSNVCYDEILDAAVEGAREGIRDAMRDVYIPDTSDISDMAYQGAEDVKNGGGELLERLDEVIDGLNGVGNIFTDFRGKQRRIIINGPDGKPQELCSFEDVGRYICDILTNEFATRNKIQNRFEAIVKLLVFIGIGNVSIYTV